MVAIFNISQWRLAKCSCGLSILIMRFLVLVAQRQLPISRHPTAGLRIDSRLCQVSYFVDLINEPLLLNPITARFLHEEPQDGATGTTEICAKCLSPREDGSSLICQTNTQANLTGLGQPHSRSGVVTAAVGTWSAASTTIYPGTCF